MRPVEKIRFLSRALVPQNVTTVVDVGANPFAGKPPYGVLRRSDCCKVVGFEPQQDAFAALVQNARHNDQFLPYAVGDGSVKTFYVTKNSGLVSTLRPIPAIGNLLGAWWHRAVVVESEIEMPTRRLDDIDEVSRIDFLKIDIQGGELEVFQNARRKLETCAAIQTEICLHPYYENQPSFGDVQSELSSQGFMAHKFVETTAHAIGNDLDLGKEQKRHRSQATVADMIFIRNPNDFDSLPNETIKQLAILSYGVFRSYDLTLRCLSDLKTKGVLSGEDIRKIIHKLDL